MNRTILAVALATALVSLSQAAQAAPITLAGSLANGSYLGAGNHAGTFDGSALLPNKFKVNSASFAFNFSDDADAMGSQSQWTGSSSTNYAFQRQIYNGNYENDYLRNTTNYMSVTRQGETESVGVSLEGIVAGFGATAMTESSSTGSQYNGRTLESRSGYNGYYATYRCGNYTCGSWVSGNFNNFYADSYTQTTTRTTDWNGAFSVTGDITDLTLLNDLLKNHQLNWNLGVSGDLFLSNASLILDVEEIKPAANGVPEPSSVLLMGLGLLGLAGMKRRRSR